MEGRAMKKAELPPVPDVRKIELTRSDRMLIEGLLATYRMEVVHLRDIGELPKSEVKIRLDHINELSEKVFPEEEAARMLQNLGFTIVEKGS
jgi:phenylalanyl-tRNA synthetase beta subunit